MATKKTHMNGEAETEAEAKLGEAMAKMKAASDRHEAIVAVVSRLGASPQERRLAQSESKKVDQEMRNAKRLLGEAQAAVRISKVPSTR